MDPDLGRYTTVWAAAGLPTAVFPVPPGTLRMLADAMVAPIAEERRAADVEAGATAAATVMARRPAISLDGGVTGTTVGQVAPEPRNATITYPGGLRARWRWGGSGQAAAVFALSEAGGALVDLGPRVARIPDALCRAELRLDGPRGPWTARFASTIYDEPRALYWDTAGLLVVAYGFHTFGLDAATGELRWDHRSATPIVALFGSSRLAHVVVQAELETFAIEPDGTVALAGGPLRRRDRGRAGRRPARAHRLRRPGQRARPGDGAPGRLIALTVWTGGGQPRPRSARIRGQPH